MARHAHRPRGCSRRWNRRNKRRGDFFGATSEHVREFELDRCDGNSSDSRAQHHGECCSSRSAARPSDSCRPAWSSDAGSATWSPCACRCSHWNLDGHGHSDRRGRRRPRRAIVLGHSIESASLVFFVPLDHLHVFERLFSQRRHSRWAVCGQGRRRQRSRRDRTEFLG